MTYDEVTAGLLEMMKDPDKADPTKTNKFLADLRADYTDKDSLSKQLKDKDEEIKRLQDRNAYYAQLAVANMNIAPKDPQKKEEQNDDDDYDGTIEDMDDVDNFLYNQTVEAEKREAAAKEDK